MTYLVSNLLWTTLEMVVLGSMLYVWDIEQDFFLYRWSLAIYRWLYNVCHKDPIPDGRVHLIYRAGIRSWTSIAMVVMFAEPIAGYLSKAIFGTRVEFKVEFVTGFAHFPAVLFGFYIGPVANYLLKRRGKIIDTMEQLEQTGIKGVMNTVQQKVTDTVAEGLRHALPHATKDEAEPQQAPVKKEDFNPDEVIRDFVKKGRPSV